MIKIIHRHNPRGLKNNIWLGLFFLAILSLAANVKAQTNLEADTSVVVVQALEMAQIPEFGTNTRQLINQTQSLTDQDTKLHDIRSNVDEIILLLNDKVELFNDSSVDIRRDQLSREEREVELLSEKLEKHKTTIESINSKRVETIFTIDSMSYVWHLTMDTIDTKLGTKNLDTTNVNNLKHLQLDIENFIDKLQLFKDNLEGQYSKISNLQTQIAVAENRIGSISSAIESQNEQLSKNIWIPDSAPIWEAKRDTSGVNKDQKFISVLSSRLNIIVIFSQNHPELPIYLLLYFSLIFGTIVYLRINAKKLYVSFGEELKEAQIILEYPFVSSLVIAWFGSLISAYLPNELNDLIATLMLVPLVFMLKKLNPKWKWSTLLLFCLSYLLFLVVNKIDYTFLPQRILLLFIGLMALAALLLFRKNNEMITRLNTYLYGTLPFILRFSILLSLVSVIANIFGSIQLAVLLVNVVLGVIIGINVLRAAVLLSRSFVFLILMGPLIRHSYILQEDSKLILDKMNSIFKFVGFASFIIIILELINIRKEVLGALLNFINFPISIGNLSFSLGNILAFFAVIFISSWLSSFIRYILEKEIYPRTKLKTSISNTISLMIKFTFIILGVLMAFAAAGIEFDKLAIAFGALGVGIGFGLQNIVNNFVSGIILAIERPMTIGDLVDIPGASGVVKDIGIRASTVRTWDGSDVIVPNGELISEKLTNWTLFDRRRRVIVEVRLPFDTDMEVVSKLLLDTAATIPEVMKKPGPYLNLKGIGTSAMEINLYCWINDSDKIFTYGTAIRKKIFKTLLEKGYDIPVPKQDLVINNGVDSKLTPGEKKTDEL